jgi:flagellar biosynthesis protein FlhB
VNGPGGELEPKPEPVSWREFPNDIRQCWRYMIHERLTWRNVAWTLLEWFLVFMLYMFATCLVILVIMALPFIIVTVAVVGWTFPIAGGLPGYTRYDRRYRR